MAEVKQEQEVTSVKKPRKTKTTTPKKPTKLQEIEIELQTKQAELEKERVHIKYLYKEIDDLNLEISKSHKWQMVYGAVAVSLAIGIVLL